MIRRRRTDAQNWEHSVLVPQGSSEGNWGACTEIWGQHASVLSHKCVLKGIRVDDWVFGVSSVSKDGFESPVASAVPGGAFKPWVKPANPAK